MKIGLEQLGVHIGDLDGVGEHIGEMIPDKEEKDPEETQEENKLNSWSTGSESNRP